ncbi:MAG TPA: 2,3-butanediol dehydrogenase [Bacillales bacterium]|nr:2,3-butanediol dehydrogenase [Bacillales bacterium]
MEAAVWYGEKDIRVEERELKEMNENEIKVKVAWAGICGSDLHEYEEGPVFVPAYHSDPLTGQQAPLTMGHEFSGIIEEVGAKVRNFKPGDRVAINPTITRGIKSSKYDIYDGFSFLGLHSDGGFADYAIVPESNVYTLPASLTLQDGALIEPAAVAVQALKEADLAIGNSIAVFGVGPIGLLTILAAKAAGATTIIALDLSETRLEKAQTVGATHVVNSKNMDPIKAIKEITTEGVDIAFEVAGVEQTFKQSIQSTKARGRMVVVSIFATSIDWNPMELTTTGVNVTSSLAYESSTFQQTIDLMAAGQLNPQKVITDIIPLYRIVDRGFEVLSSDKSHAKILVELSGEM